MPAQKNESTGDVPPEAWAWLRQINQQSEYDEYMEREREHWLWIRPPKRKTR